MGSGSVLSIGNQIRWIRRIIVLILLRVLVTLHWMFALSSPSAVHAQDFFSSITQTKTVVWNQQPLAEVLDSFSQAIEIPIWLDRRVDPTMRVDLQATAAWHEIVDQIANTLNLRAVAVPKLFVVAQREDADRIASSILATRKLLSTAPGFSKLATQSQRVQWPFLAQPQQIAHYIAQQWKCEIDQEGLPHDLWRQGDFARMDGATLLALLGGSFDRVPIVRDNRVTWGEMPKRIQVTQRYPVKPGTRWEDHVRQADPLSKSNRLAGGSIELVATAAGHQALALSQATKLTKPVGETPYEIQLVNQPATAVVQMLARTKGWEVRWTSGTEPKDAKLLSFRKNGTVADFLDEICKQTGWQWKVVDKVLTMGTAENPLPNIDRGAPLR